MVMLVSLLVCRGQQHRAIHRLRSTDNPLRTAAGSSQESFKCRSARGWQVRELTRGGQLVPAAHGVQGRPDRGRGDEQGLRDPLIEGAVQRHLYPIGPDHDGQRVHRDHPAVPQPCGRSAIEHLFGTIVTALLGAWPRSRVR